jgi:hypothetical protein
MSILNMALNFTFVCGSKKLQVWHESNYPPIHVFTLHLHHQGGDLHPINMDWKGPLHSVGLLSTSCINHKIDFPLHLQGLMVMRLVNFIMI